MKNFVEELRLFLKLKKLISEYLLLIFKFY